RAASLIPANNVWANEWCHRCVDWENKPGINLHKADAVKNPGTRGEENHQRREHQEPPAQSSHRFRTTLPTDVGKRREALVVEELHCGYGHAETTQWPPARQQLPQIWTEGS